MTSEEFTGTFCPEQATPSNRTIREMDGVSFTPTLNAFAAPIQNPAKFHYFRRKLSHMEQ
jgi:hypothetical protein